MINGGYMNIKNRIPALCGNEKIQGKPYGKITLTGTKDRDGPLSGEA